MQLLFEGSDYLKKYGMDLILVKLYNCNSQSECSIYNLSMNNHKKAGLLDVVQSPLCGT